MAPNPINERDEISIIFTFSSSSGVESLFIAKVVPSGENSIAETLSIVKLAIFDLVEISNKNTLSSCTDARIVLSLLIAINPPSSALLFDHVDSIYVSPDEELAEAGVKMSKMIEQARVILDLDTPAMYLVETISLENMTEDLLQASGLVTSLQILIFNNYCL